MRPHPYRTPADPPPVVVHREPGSPDRVLAPLFFALIVAVVIAGHWWGARAVADTGVVGALLILAVSLVMARLERERP